MKLIKTLPVTILAMIGCFPLMACASTKTLPSDGLAIVVLPAADVQIVQRSARQEGGGVAVDGQIRRKITGGRGVVKGHVDIKLLDRKGETIREVFASCSPRIIPNRGTLTSSFSARIPIVASPESVISLRFHNGHHEG